SEYQYYEFQAIDRPLDERAMAALRAITSRARITPTSLVNVYHFGDFKGDPDRRVEERERQEAERAAQEQARRAQEQAAARARHLDALAGREEELWQQVETAINTRLPKEYDHAVELLRDLRDLARRTGSGEAFAGRVRQPRERHRNKRTLLQRLNRAGLPK